MPTFLHAADLHVDSPLRGLPSDLGARARDATRQAFRNLVACALQRQVAFVLLAGDIFDDAHQSISTSAFLATELRALSQAKIPVFLLRGNHDYLARGCRVPWPEGVHEFASTAPTTRQLDALRVAIHGQSYPEKHVRRDLTAAYPAPVSGYLNIGLLHTSLDGHADDHQTYAPTREATLASKGYAYWALGHVHRFVDLQADSSRIVYPGNLQGRHVRETGPKGAVLGTYEGHTITQVEHVPLDVLRWHSLDITLDDELQELSVAEQFSAAAAEIASRTDADRQQGRSCAVRLVLRGLRPDALDEPVTVLRDRLRQAVGHVLGETALLEDVSFEAALERRELPRLLLDRLDAAESNLRSGSIHEPPADLLNLVQKITTANIEELALALQGRKLSREPHAFWERALHLGRQALDARLSK